VFFDNSKCGETTMTNEEKTQHTLKKDKHDKVLGGNFHFLNVYYSKTRSDGTYSPSHRDPGGGR